MNREMFRSRRVVSNAIRPLSDDVRSIVAPDDSPGGRYRAYFMTTDDGPTMVVSHEGTPNAVTGSELARDLQQIYGAGPAVDPPQRLVIQVARGQEDDARNAASSVIDGISGRLSGGRQFRLDELDSDFPSDDTVGLVFSLTEVRDAAPGVIDAGQGRSQPESDGQPAPDPFADLRTDAALVTIPNEEAFRLATDQLQKSKPGYRDFIAALHAYQGEITDYEEGARVMRAAIAEVGRERTERIDRISELRRDLERDRERALKGGRSLMISTRQWRDELNRQDADGRDAVDALEAAVDRQLREARELQDAIQQNERELVRLTASVQEIDVRLARRMDENRALLRTRRDRLAGRGDRLVALARTYRDELQPPEQPPEAASRRTASVVALVQHVIEAAGSPDQRLRQLHEVARRVWGAELPHQLTGPGHLLNSGTASEVFLVATIGPIGESGTRTGYAKRAVLAGGESNATITNLGLATVHDNVAQRDVVTEAPNLIARQVVTSRLARALGLDVIVDEVFSADADGRTLGVSAKAPGRPLRRSEPTPPLVMDDGGAPILKRYVFAQVDLRDGEHSGAIQKRLSDLQLIDALTGQMDRHAGNIFIDEKSGRVYGIDNDMAFPHRDYVESGTSLRMFAELPLGLRYFQRQIDAGTAQRVLDLDEATLERIIRGEEGDPERLGDAEVESAKIRLRAIQAHIRNLERAGALIGGPGSPWGPDTFNAALLDSGDASLGSNVRAEELNYVARTRAQYLHAADPTPRGLDGAQWVQEVQGV